MNEHFKPPSHGTVNKIVNKFKRAFRGIAVGSRRQSSFVVHLCATALVLGAATWLEVTTIEWCLLAVCITIVFALELSNSSIESLARAIDREHNEQLRDALDIASGAVLVSAIGTAAIGIAILVPRMFQLLP